MNENPMTNELEARYLQRIHDTLPGRELDGFAGAALSELIDALKSGDNENIRNQLPWAHIVLSLLELRYEEDATAEEFILRSIYLFHDQLHREEEEYDDDE